MASSFPTVHDLSEADALELIGRLAKEVHQLHEDGLVHREIRACAQIDRNAKQYVLPPPSAQSKVFGRESMAPEDCPKEFQSVGRVEIPRERAAASAALATAGIALKPEQIDLHQLGTLFWELVTGRSHTACLEDSAQHARLAPDLQALFDRALHSEPGKRFDSAAELATLADDLLQRLRRLPSRRLGHYLLLEPIGTGGMGQVYKAYEPALERLVAVKILRAELMGNSNLIRRFHSEAAAAARLAHRNIVSVYFSGEDRGFVYYAMELIQGETLALNLTGHARLPVAESLHVVEQVLAALDAAHTEGLVHRDIKPRNILIESATGRAVVADFGLVKYLNRPGDLTSTGMVLGTVEYISPEQGLGQAIDCRSDLYSVGVVMFRLLSGRLPFKADHPSALIYQHVHTPPPALNRIAPDVPPPLCAIVDRLMRKSPDERYRTAREVLHDLNQFRAGRPDLKITVSFKGSNTDRSIDAGSPSENLSDSHTAHWTESESELGPYEAPPALRNTAPSFVRGLRNRPKLIAGSIVVLAIGAAVGILLNPAFRPRSPATGLTGPAPETSAGAGAPEVTVPGPEIGPATRVEPDKANERATQWLLRLGGVGQIAVDQVTREVAAATDVPAAPFRLLEINLKGNANVNDEELASLPSLPDLKELNLALTKVTDMGVRALPEFPRLQTLYLSQTNAGDAALESLRRYGDIHILNLDGTRITDEGLGKVALLVRIEILSMVNTSVTDAGLKELRHFPKLMMLGLNGTQVGDAGMQHVKHLSTLTHLHLSRTKLTDAGLMSLHGLKMLSQLEIRDTQVTDDGVAAIQSALPNCKITR